MIFLVAGCSKRSAKPPMKYLDRSWPKKVWMDSPSVLFHADRKVVALCSPVGWRREMMYSWTSGNCEVRPRIAFYKIPC